MHDSRNLKSPFDCLIKHLHETAIEEEEEEEQFADDRIFYSFSSHQAIRVEHWKRRHGRIESKTGQCFLNRRPFAYFVWQRKFFILYAFDMSQSIFLAGKHIDWMFQSTVIKFKSREMFLKMSHFFLTQLDVTLVRTFEPGKKSICLSAERSIHYL